MYYVVPSLLLTASFALGAPAKLSKADIDILIGQQVIYSYPTNAAPPQQLLDLTSQGLVGGIILFGENIDAEETPAGMIALQEAYAGSPAPAAIEAMTGVANAPLLIMTDQEGGKVKRIKELGPYMSAKEVGQEADVVAAGTQTGVDAAEALITYENNCNLAPVVDVSRTDGDLMDSVQRSYSKDPAVVAEAASAFIKAQQDAGAAATVKHFPGLGAAPADGNTDLVPLTLNLTMADIQETDYVPYEAAIAAGVDLVMGSWAIYPALDAKLPAGLSKKWLQGQLRGELGFQGVTITDAIEAGALTPFGNDGTRGVMAKSAGMDLILAAGRNVSQGVAVADAIGKAVVSGEIEQADLDAAMKRVAALRAKYA